MGSKHNSLETSNAENKERAQEINRNAEVKASEAEESSSALRRIEAADDDTQEAVENALSACSEIARQIMEQDIDSPGEEVNKGFEEIKVEAMELAEQESENASIALETTGDYNATGSELSEQFSNSQEGFENIAEDSETTSEQMASEREAYKSRIGELWEV